MIAEVIFVVLMILAFLMGAVFGTGTERRSWLARALPRNTTPHHCNGEFYYIVPEKIFCNEFERRRIVPPQGGSGTAPVAPPPWKQVQT